MSFSVVITGFASCFCSCSFNLAGSGCIILDRDSLSAALYPPVLLGAAFLSSCLVGSTRPRGCSDRWYTFRQLSAIAAMLFYNICVVPEHLLDGVRPSLLGLQLVALSSREPLRSQPDLLSYFKGRSLLSVLSSQLKCTVSFRVASSTA